MFLRIQIKGTVKLNLNDLFYVKLSNPLKDIYSVRIKYEIVSENDGIYIGSLSEKFTVMPLADTLLDLEKLTYKKIESNSESINYLIKNAGAFPPGLYNICVTIINSYYETNFGDDCIQIISGAENP